MKNSIDRLKRETDATSETCNEEKCATCFENRGCMFEQYVSAMMNKIEEAYLANHVTQTIQHISRRA